MTKALAKALPGDWTPEKVQRFNAADIRGGLIFDVDGAQFLPSGDPCSVCGCQQTPGGKPRAFVRVRRMVANGAEPVAQLCPNCIARAMIQIERCSLWGEMSPAVRGAVKAALGRRKRVAKRKGSE